jgi:DNA-directed RNA polymerase subunit RPC12/RpoP
MSEFKFACPVCGQHITATSESSGTQIQCPTCFQKIVVPQAPAANSKFILNASQADKPRPRQAALEERPAPKAKSRFPAGAGLIALVLLAAAGTALFAFRSQLGFLNGSNPVVTNATPAAAITVKGDHPVPWTTNLDKVRLPEGQVTGSLRGQDFSTTRATLQGGTFSLRQGRGSPPDLAVSIIFPARRGEDLGGKKIRVTHDQPPPVPRVVMRWKNDEGKGVSKSYTNGYSLLLNFGEPAMGRITGKLYLAFPDDHRSVIAGSFDAEIRAPEVRKKKTPPAKT